MLSFCRPKIVTVHQPLVARRPLVGRRPLVASLLFSLCHCVYVTLSLFLHLHSIHFVRGRRFLFLFCNRLATGCIMEIGEKINGYEKLESLQMRIEKACSYFSHFCAIWHILCIVPSLTRKQNSIIKQTMNGSLII